MVRRAAIWATVTAAKTAHDGGMLPSGTTLGTVTLTIAHLPTSLAFYEGMLGFTVITHTTTTATLGTPNGTPLIHLVQDPSVQPRPQQGAPGVYHYAVLLPARADLGRFVQVLREHHIPAGAGDHLVSEAFYFSDPDGIGIEMYADRPRENWPTDEHGNVEMATLPVDVGALEELAAGTTWNGIPNGTVIGHLHFHAGDLAEASAFYEHVIGFDSLLKMNNSVHFLATGGYHHHIGLNTWARGGGDNLARLSEWELVLPSEESKTPVRERAGVHGDIIAGPDGVQVALTVRRA